MQGALTGAVAPKAQKEAAAQGNAVMDMIQQLKMGKQIMESAEPWYEVRNANLPSMGQIGNLNYAVNTVAIPSVSYSAATIG